MIDDTHQEETADDDRKKSAYTTDCRSQTRRPRSVSTLKKTRSARNRYFIHGVRSKRDSGRAAQRREESLAAA
eukprot:scaffold478677_cov11-Prasinocladus_malaysianus.AAC.1